MESMKRLLATFALVTVFGGTLAEAHHSFARFYFEEETISIEGELFEFKFRSPHAWLYVMTEDADGTMRLFAAEWANANRLGREGVTGDTLQPGDRIIITGSPGRNPSEHQIHLKNVERPADGWTWHRASR